MATFFDKNADVAELADAHDSGSCARNGVEVQVLSSAPRIEVVGESLLILPFCSWGLLFTYDRGFCHRPLRTCAELSCESQLPKVDTRVRAPSPAPSKSFAECGRRTKNARYTPAHTAKTQRLQYGASGILFRLPDALEMEKGVPLRAL